MATEEQPINRRWGAAPVLLALVMLLMAGAACAFNAPDRLNEGQGTRDKPVAARKFAKTPHYEVRALSVVRPSMCRLKARAARTRTSQANI